MVFAMFDINLYTQKPDFAQHSLIAKWLYDTSVSNSCVTGSWTVNKSARQTDRQTVCLSVSVGLGVDTDRVQSSFADIRKASHDHRGLMPVEPYPG
jgi:hypothetical protein